MEGGQQDLTSRQANKVRLLLPASHKRLCPVQIIAEALEVHYQCHLTNVSFPFSDIYHHSGMIFVY